MNLTLEERWRVLCDSGGLDGDVGWLSLLQGYTEPHRAYHNLKHIEDCLLRFDEHAHLAADPAAVEFAIWFHDIVYDTHSKDSEERSAEVAADFLSGTQFETSVVELILATKHDSFSRTGDASLLCDIDLSILGRTPDE
jgi:predicted metal-dependent HD superfamily phosphohydrolase